MRITQKNLQRTYLSGLNRNLKQLSESNERLNTGRRFSRVSQNVTDAQRALKVRDQLRRNEQYATNVSNIQVELHAQETKTMQIHDLLQDVKELVVKGYSDTNSATDKKIVANEIASIRESMLQIINSKTTDRHTFATVRNESPMTVNEHNEVFFYGASVDQNDASAFLNQRISMNVGTQMDLSTSALDILGHGTTPEGTPKNILRLLSSIEQELTLNKSTHRQAYMSQLDDASNQMLMKVTDIGARNSYLERTLSRLQDENLSLTTQQNHLESIDFEEEVIFNKSFEMAWQISLQLGSKVLPQSIFDFMR